MPIIQRASFETSDGKIFGSQDEAEIHQTEIDLADRVETLCAELEIPNRTMSTLKRWLPTLLVSLNYVPAPSEPYIPDMAEEEPSSENMTLVDAA